MKYSGGNHWENAMGGLSFVPGEYAVYKNGICYRLSLRMSTQNSAGFSDATPPPTPEPGDLDYTILLKIISTFSVP
jgi:hypothetical protein